MKKVFLSLMLFATVSVIITSCKKEAAPEETPQTAPTATTPAINIVDADGAMTAVKTITIQTAPVIGEFEVEVGTAVGAFLKNKNVNELVAAGTVTCNGKTLTKQGNNAYLFNPSSSDPQGLDYSSGVSWDVSGSADVPEFSGTFDGNFPTNPKWTKTNITTGGAVTLTLNSQVQYADSIIVSLATNGGGVSKTFAGNTTSFTFTADECSKLSKGDGLVQFAPWSYELSPAPGKKIYFVNEAVLSVITKFE